MDKNLTTYRSKHVVKWYESLNFMVAAEQAVFERYRALVENGSLLDIGFGGGRTTAWLLTRCKAYTGLDYSQEFVNAVKKKYPQANLAMRDARDLSAYSDNSFEFINFSFNGIDYVDLHGREKILSEVYRVLKPGGVFFFSTHNRSHASFDEWPWNNRTISTLVKIKTFVKLIPFLNRKIANQKHEIQNADYAIINDSAHNYNLMTFYSSPAFLRKQLLTTGFVSPEFYNTVGEQVNDALLNEWIYATVIKNS